MKYALAVLTSLLALVVAVPSSSFAAEAQALAAVVALQPASPAALADAAAVEQPSQDAVPASTQPGKEFINWLEKQPGHPQNKSPLYSCNLCYRLGLTCCIDPYSHFASCIDPEVGCS